MAFFTFSQNNSGGNYRGPAKYVIIEAIDGDTANMKALQHGLYFNGVGLGIDCPCCGDRWYPCYDEGTDVPMIYGKPVENTKDFSKEIPTYLVINSNGVKVLSKS